MKPVRLGIVVAEFNYDVTSLLLKKALSHAKFLGAEVAYVVKAPGTFDVPFMAKQLLEKPEVDAVVALGAVIQGATRHDEVVAHQAARKLMDLGLEYGKPVTLGIIGPGASRMQALERVDDYARRAVEAAVKLVRRSAALREAKFEGETVDVE